jgi:hypothetical protein
MSPAAACIVRISEIHVGCRPDAGLRFLGLLKNMAERRCRSSTRRLALVIDCRTGGEATLARCRRQRRGLERCIIAPRRNSRAHLHRAWRAKGRIRRGNFFSPFLVAAQAGRNDSVASTAAGRKQAMRALTAIGADTEARSYFIDRGASSCGRRNESDAQVLEMRLFDRDNHQAVDSGRRGDWRILVLRSS